jgi:hypothetical protein
MLPTNMLNLFLLGNTRENKDDIKLKKRANKKIQKGLPMNDTIRLHHAQNKCARFQKHLECLLCNQSTKITLSTGMSNCPCGGDRTFVTVVNLQYTNGDHYTETVPFMTKVETAMEWKDHLPSTTDKDITLWWHVYKYFNGVAGWRVFHDKMNRSSTKAKTKTRIIPDLHENPIGPLDVTGVKKKTKRPTKRTKTKPKPKRTVKKDTKKRKRADKQKNPVCAGCLKPVTNVHIIKAHGSFSLHKKCQALLSKANQTMGTVHGVLPISSSETGVLDDDIWGRIQQGLFLQQTRL